MHSKNGIRERDMEFIHDIFKFISCDCIPLRFEYGEQTVCGIPDAFSPKVTHRILTENVLQYIIEGSDENGLCIRAEYLEYRDFPVTEWVFYLTNNGSKDTPILKNIRIGRACLPRRRIGIRKWRHEKRGRLSFLQGTRRT